MAIRSINRCSIRVFRTYYDHHFHVPLAVWSSFRTIQWLCIVKRITSYTTRIIINKRNRFIASDSAYSYTFLRKVVYVSVGRLSYSCTLFKPFDGFACYLVDTLVGSHDTLLNEVSCFWSLVEKDIRQLNPSQNCTCLLMIHQRQHR